jgi:hypothetical protein
MATIVRGVVPASEFALQHSLEAVTDLEFEIERIVDTGDQAVMPLLWVRGVEEERAVEAFEADPSVTGAEVIAAVDDECLFRMEWVDNVELILQMLTNAEATILDAYGKRDRWKLRMMYAERDHLSTVHDFCNDHGLTFDVESVRELEGEPAGRFGLTAEQFEALTAATERGLYSVPREVTLEELAEEFDVSHQALSERIRRATGALVEDALLVGFSESEVD